MVVRTQFFKFYPFQPHFYTYYFANPLSIPRVQVTEYKPRIIKSQTIELMSENSGVCAQVLNRLDIVT